MQKGVDFRTKLMLGVEVDTLTRSWMIQIIVVLVVPTKHALG